MDELRVASDYVMPELREQAYRRLSSVEGQIRGLKKMLDEQRPCMDILVQLSATSAALREVTKLMMRNYLERCATAGLESGDREKMKATYDEIMDAFFKFNR